MPTDDELIAEIKNGSQAAMEVLVKKHYRSVFAYLYRKTGDEHIANDLTQEVFIKMMKAIPRYESSGKFTHWLITIAVNHHRDTYRSKMFKQKQLEQQLDARIRDERGNVWDLLSKKMESERVRQVLLRLPEFQREAIILRFYHGMKIKEIAAVTQQKEATVKSRLKQGLHKLRTYLVGGHEDGKAGSSKR